jgi:hypothetical protein
VIYKLVDDGTEVLACLLWTQVQNDKFRRREDVSNMIRLCALGKRVRVSGKLTMYKSFVQINIHNMVEVDCGEECLFWLEVMELTNSLYDNQSIHELNVKYTNDEVSMKSTEIEDTRLYEALRSLPNYAENPFLLQHVFEDEQICNMVPFLHDTIDDGERYQLLRAALDRLLATGRLVCRCHQERFELIQATDLIPFIERFITTQLADNPLNNEGGVHIKYIVKHIRSNPFFSCVQERMIKEAIKYMVTESC